MNEIDFVWEVGTERDDTVWKQRFHKLVKYKKKHGDCLVPYNYEQNPKLGRWVTTQRYEHKKWLNGVYSTITQDRIDQLNEIDFVWVVGTHQFQRDDTVWKLRLKELKACKQKHGDCLVSRLDKHNRKLGIWVMHQRQEYKKWLQGENAKITQERIDQLNEICLLYTSPSPRDRTRSRMPSSA